MKIAVASDHRGIEMKARVLDMIRTNGHEGLDYGPLNSDSVDYPDFAGAVAGDVGQHKIDRGILICGTGIGMCIAANKLKGIRAALAQDELSAQLSRTHNDANVLCLSADLIGQTLVKRIVDVWFRTGFDGGRHERRLGKIVKIENGLDPSAA